MPKLPAEKGEAISVALQQSRFLYARVATAKILLSKKHMTAQLGFA